MRFEYNDALYRSRNTILDILDEQGFEVARFRGFSPKEVEGMTIDLNIAQIDAAHKTDEEKKARVIYWGQHFNRKITKKIITQLQLGYVEEDAAMSKEEAENFTCYIMMNEPITDVHHIEAVRIWNTTGMKAYFCCIYNFINNPLKHVLVPKHEIVPPEQHDLLLKELLITSKSQLPIIRYHIDTITRCLGAIPKDIIKITRPSPSAGEYIVYRVCMA
jgi:DNA-directed RNA polymerase subunit H